MRLLDVEEDGQVLLFTIKYIIVVSLETRSQGH